MSILERASALPRHERLAIASALLEGVKDMLLPSQEVKPVKPVQQPQPRTRATAGKNEQDDISSIVAAINNRTHTGLQIISALTKKYGYTILQARSRAGNRSHHYDFEVLIGSTPGIWMKVEQKGSKDYTQISQDQTPWAAGVQFHNGGCEKYSIGKIYAQTWYNTHIGSGTLKQEWSLKSPIPSFNDWFKYDAKAQGDPKTQFGQELKRVLRNNGASLLDRRNIVHDAFTPTAADLHVFKEEVQREINRVLSEKDLWLTIHGDLSGKFYCEWYPKYTLTSINSVVMRKEKDIHFDFKSNEFNFSCILRWGKGAGFSNLRIDAK